MIRRHYFMSAKKYHINGSGGFRWEYIHFDHVSWFEESFDAFQYGLSQIEKRTKHIDGDQIHVICFSRC